ncbi:MAG: helix-turn-helix transcriptional regulator [Candidatus Thermoplasmatota archaeon]|nr:helix-turn-helix transcriptional regulator [Candidatus Thermoplasmatota archaeon]
MVEELEKVEKFLELAPDSEVDEYAKDNLKKKLFKWRNADVDYLADLEYFVNGKRFDKLLEVFYEIENLEKLKINFLKPNTDGEWNFSKPVKELKLKGGKGVCETFDYDPTSLNKWANAEKSKMEKVMVRGFITDFFVPISINTKSEYHRAEEVPRQYEPHLKKLGDLWSDIREGVLPFTIRLCLYTQTKRYPILIDPINDKLKPHPLKDVIRMDRTDKEPIDYMKFDRVLAWMEFPVLVKKIFELLFETEEMAVSDIAHSLNMDVNVAKNNLKSLKTKDFVKKNKEEYYQINMEKLEKMAKKLSE